MTRAWQFCLAVVALATSARAAGPSKAVLALRASPARCNVTDEPKRFMVFTRQRSGSRWFVDTISALGDGRRFVEPHIRELSLNGTTVVLEGHEELSDANSPCGWGSRNVSERLEY